jgi:DNA-directed RNA polymerase specialized sigma24 family protein
MQDRDVVAAIVAGEPAGIAEAYDRYAASLYAYCHSMLPGPEATEAVRDTFLISVLRLDGLRDPDRLDAWLHAVARNECLRRLGPKNPKEPKDPKERKDLKELAGALAAAAPVPRSADPGELPAVTLPTELRRQVLTACADNSPAGRAHRVSVTHRAGAFGPSGFPKAIGPAGPRWWQRLKLHPRPVAVLAVMAALAAAAGITMITTAGGSQRPQASALGLGAGAVGLSSSTSSATLRPPGTPGKVRPASSPTHQAAPSASPPTPSVTMPAGAPSPVPPSATMTGEPSPTPTPSPSPSPSTSPAQGYLMAAPHNLLLTAAQGKAASGFFVLTATGGPVSEYTIKVPAAVATKVRVSPTKGSLPAGGYAVVTVTVTSKVALNTYVTVEPGNLTITVTLKIKA